MALASLPVSPSRPPHRRAPAAGDVAGNLERGEVPWLDRAWLISIGAVIPDIDARLRNHPHEAFVELFAATGMDSTSGASTSFYCVFDDTIHLVAGPHADPDQHLRDWIHELVHATGHASRLGRALPDSFGRHVHPREDLVVEIGTAIVCLGLDIAPRLRHPDAIPGWIELLCSDPSQLPSAMADARAAAAWLFACRDAQAAAYELWLAGELQREREEAAAASAARRVRRQMEVNRWALRYAALRRRIGDRRRGRRLGEPAPAGQAGLHR